MRWNRRFVLFAEAHGKTPDEMVNEDINRERWDKFGEWLQERWDQWLAERRSAANSLTPRLLCDDDPHFNRWLEYWAARQKGPAVLCGQCNGTGWVFGHANDCSCGPDSCAPSCPTQVQCQICRGTGFA